MRVKGVVTQGAMVMGKGYTGRLVESWILELDLLNTWMLQFDFEVWY